MYVATQTNTDLLTTETVFLFFGCPWIKHLYVQVLVTFLVTNSITLKVEFFCLLMVSYLHLRLGNAAMWSNLFPSILHCPFIFPFNTAWSGKVSLTWPCDVPTKVKLYITQPNLTLQINNLRVQLQESLPLKYSRISWLQYVKNFKSLCTLKMQPLLLKTFMHSKHPVAVFYRPLVMLWH